MKLVRVLLVDDHQIRRAGLRALLEKLVGVEVAAEADDGREALQLIHSHSPDVVFVDLLMPVMNGIELSARVSQENPNARVLILSGQPNEVCALQAFRAGAAGYLVKEASPAELDLALRTVARGDRYLSPAVSKHFVADYVDQIAGRNGSSKSLTLRQREVLKLIAEGYSTKEIAHRLGISVKTIETHRAEIMTRLEVYNLAGLIRYAIRAGLVAAEQQEAG